MMKNDQKNQLSTISKIHTAKYKFKANKIIINVYVSYQEESLSTQSENCERFLMLRKLFEVNIFTCVSAMI